VVDHDDALDASVRVGLISYGVVHVLMAWLALQLAFGDRQGNVSGNGAFRQVAATDLGRATLFVVAGGLATLVVWQLFEAAVGHRDEDGAKRAGMRVASVGRAAVFAFLGYGAARIALGAGGGGSGTDSMTAQLMSQPFGQVLVALVGATVVGIALALAYIGLTEGFLDNLRGHGRKEGAAYRWLGKAGYLSKGVAFAIVGGLLVYAAWTHNPDKSAGIDQALLQILEQPLGPVMLGTVAVGICAFGLFCFAWARHLDR
jgi:hypothetical protein